MERVDATNALPPETTPPRLTETFELYFYVTFGKSQLLDSLEQLDWEGVAVFSPDLAASARSEADIGFIWAVQVGSDAVSHLVGVDETVVMYVYHDSDAMDSPGYPHGWTDAYCVVWRWHHDGSLSVLPGDLPSRRTRGRPSAFARIGYDPDPNWTCRPFSAPLGADPDDSQLDDVELGALAAFQSRWAPSLAYVLLGGEVAKWASDGCALLLTVSDPQDFYRALRASVVSAGRVPTGTDATFPEEEAMNLTIGGMYGYCASRAEALLGPLAPVAP